MASKRRRRGEWFYNPPLMVEPSSSNNGSACGEARDVKDSIQIGTWRGGGGHRSGHPTWGLRYSLQYSNISECIESSVAVRSTKAKHRALLNFGLQRYCAQY